MPAASALRIHGHAKRTVSEVAAFLRAVNDAYAGAYVFDVLLDDERQRLGWPAVLLGLALAPSGADGCGGPSEIRCSESSTHSPSRAFLRISPMLPSPPATARPPVAKG